MTLRTGTSKTGAVDCTHTCSTCARAGKSACKGRSIRMDQLDGLVTGQIIDRLLGLERLGTMLSSLASLRAAKAATVDERIGILEKQVNDTDDRPHLVVFDPDRGTAGK